MSIVKIMKPHFTHGFVALLGMASSALAIEPPDTAAPIPPQPAAEEVADEPASPPVEMPQFRQRVLPRNPDAVSDAVAEDRAYLGVGASQVPDILGEHLKLEPGNGVVVRSLAPNGPAAKAGLEQNDVITKVSGNAVGSHEQLRETIGGLKPGEEVDVDYIHRGEAKTARVTLGSAPADAGIAAGAEPLDQLMEGGMAQDQAKRIREVIEQNRKAFEGLQGALGDDPEQLLGEGIQKRMQQMIEGLQIQGLNQGGINLKSSGTIRMLDEKGSVELKSQDGGKEVRVLGKDGKVQWEGPYDTPQDKEAAPPEIRERIERLNVDWGFKGNGLRLHMQPGRLPDGE